MIDELLKGDEAEKLASLLDEDILQTELMARSMSEFIKGAWHVVEPATPYIHGWHVDAICEHLEAVSRGEIKNLIINIPPRHAKSTIVSVMWPAWEWIAHPHIRWLFSSYSEHLSKRDNLKCRRLILSKWYQSRWGHIYKIVKDQNQKIRFENDKTGYRVATSVGGSATGEGGDRVVVDDPIKASDARSDAIRSAANEWWDQTMSTRLNNMDTGARVIIMQRLHEDDLTGHVLEAMAAGGEHYEHLCLPAEYEPTNYVTSIGWKDPRTKAGELLWPQRFNREWVDNLKVTLGSYGAAGQLQQRPAPEGGGIFQREWFDIVRHVPPGARYVRYWDKAGSDDSGDYTVGCLMARTPDGTYYVADIVRGRWSAMQRERIIKHTAEKDGQSVEVWVEQEPGSGGKESAQATIRNLAGFTVRAERPTGDKVTRADPMAAQAEAGNIKLVEAIWNRDFLDELSLFPYGKHDDQVDAAAGAFSKLSKPRQVRRPTSISIRHYGYQRVARVH